MDVHRGMRELFAALPQRTLEDTDLHIDSLKLSPASYRPLHHVLSVHLNLGTT